MSLVIHSPALKTSAKCEPILRALPDWFGIEEATAYYVRETESHPTLLAELDGKSLVRHVAEAAMAAGLAQTVLVTGHLADEVAAQVADLDIHSVLNPDYADGMASSIRAGMRALDSDTEAVLILLGDMPRVGSGDLKRLIAAYREKDTNLIVTATAEGKRGNPVLWDRRFFYALNALSGDVGARHVIADNPGFVAEVDGERRVLQSE